MEKLGVFREIVPLDIVEQFAPSAGESDQATAGVEIFPVSPEMLGERIDTRREQRDLDVTGTGVGVVNSVFGNDFRFIDLSWHMFFCCTAAGACCKPVNPARKPETPLEPGSYSGPAAGASL